MVSTAYSPRTTLRQIDNDLLHEYGKHREIWEDIDFKKLKQTDIEPLYKAITSLEEAKRDRIEKDLREIASLAEKKKIHELYTILQRQHCDIPAFEKKRNHHDKAMWAWLHHQNLFQQVLFFDFGDTSKRHWNKYNYPLKCTVSTEEETNINLCNAITDYFRTNDGRAKHNKIEHHHFNGNEYLICYPSEYPDESQEWNAQGELEPRLHCNAFEIIFVFKKNGAAVSVYANESKVIRDDLFEIWARKILSIDNVIKNQKRSYNLKPFERGTKDIIIPPESPIKSLRMNKLRFVPDYHPNIIHTIEASPKDHPDIIFDNLRRTGLSIDYIRQVGLEATIQGKQANETKVIKFELSSKTCSLPHEDEAGIIRDFLIQTGIDLTT